MKIYTAESQVRNPSQVLKSMFTGIIKGRYLGYRLFLRDVRGEYSKSLLTIFWDFLDPLILASIFIILQKIGLVRSGDIGIPYAVYVLYGFLLFQTFTESLTYPMGTIGRSRALILHQRVTPEALLVATFYRIAFNASFRVVILAAISVYMSTFTMSGFIKFLLLFPMIIFAGMSFGVLLAPFNTIYNDVAKFVGIIVRPLLYVTPVMWSFNNMPTMQWLDRINPLSSVLVSLRTLATQDYVADPDRLIISACLILVVLFVGWFIFHLSIPILTDRV